MRFALPRLASHLPHLAAILSLGLTTACGDKGGDDDPGTPGGGVETVFAFESGIEGFKFEAYDPGEAADPTYDNIASTTDAAHARTAAEAAMNAKISYDAGNGPDGKPGRAKLEMAFNNWNQLADIQVNFMGENIKDWAGKKLKAQVMLESGFSMNASCPGGTYLFVKTGAEYVWAKGNDTNLDQTTLGQWQAVSFIIDLPAQANTPYDPVSIVSVGLQFYSNSGSGCMELPEPAVVYVDAFTVEDSM
jgi:hypothetical protein